MMFINLHTHTRHGEGEKSIVSLFKKYEEVYNPGYYSIAIHPWYVNNLWIAQFEEIKNFFSLKNVVAVGETGLDKIVETNWQLQQLAFTSHIQLANSLKKPLIIHCVKAWDEVQTLLKKERVTVPVIFHGYTKNQALAKQLTDKGYYLSFGKAIEKGSLQNVLKTIPMNQVFLETDDAGLPISTIYKYAAEALSVDMNSLSLQLQQNAMAVFGPSFIL